MTVRIRPLCPADFDPIAEVLAAAYGRPEGWRDEVARFHAVQPDGWFVAVLDGKPAGMGGATDYGPFSWIGLMAVDPAMQRRGIGRAILDRILAWIRDRGCPMAVLDASAAGERLYERYGFVDHGATMLFQRDAQVAPPAPSNGVTSLQPSDLEELVRFDAPIFGADRGPILASFLGDDRVQGLVVRDGSGAITGYLFVQPDRLGPWVADGPDSAEALLSAALSRPFDRPLTVRAPSLNPSAERLLTRYGFRLQRSLRHMYLGPVAPPQDRSHIYSEASFAIG